MFKELSDICEGYESSENVKWRRVVNYVYSRK
jgi:hypothetical protein